MSGNTSAHTHTHTHIQPVTGGDGREARQTDRRAERGSDGVEWDAICNTKPRVEPGLVRHCHAHITALDRPDVTTKTSNYFSSSDFYCNIGPDRPPIPPPPRPGGPKPRGPKLRRPGRSRAYTEQR